MRALLFVGLAACSSKPAAIDARIFEDAAGKHDAAASLCHMLDPDAGMFDGPGCGCAIGDRACPGCHGAMGACQSCGGGIGCGEGPVPSATCDGPEDCHTGSATICCANSVPTCAAACPAPGQIACHVDADCIDGGTCCPSNSAWGKSCRTTC